MKKPTVLYYFDVAVGKKKVKKHILGKNCCVHLVNPNISDTYWGNHDIYGHNSLARAKDVEIFATEERIYEDISWLRELSKNKNWRMTNEV